MTKALLVIDVQNDYFSGGKMELVGAQAAAQNVHRLQSHFRQNSWPVINVQHVALGAGATFFLPDTFGVEINQDALPVDAEAIVVKHFPNAFRDTNLKGLLEDLGVTDLTVAGMMTHMCVDTTVRAASDLGFKVTLVGDACATKDLEFEGTVTPAALVQVAYLAAIDGSFADVVSAQAILGE